MERITPSQPVSASQSVPGFCSATPMRSNTDSGLDRSETCIFRGTCNVRRHVLAKTVPKEVHGCLPSASTNGKIEPSYLVKINCQTPVYFFQSRHSVSHPETPPPPSIATISTWTVKRHVPLAPPPTAPKAWHLIDARFPKPHKSRLLWSRWRRNDVSPSNDQRPRPTPTRRCSSSTRSASARFAMSC